MMRSKFLSFLGLAKRSGNLLDGYNKCEETLGKRSVHLVIFSNEISAKSKDKFTKKCEKLNISCIDGFSKEELGASIGKKEINIVGITDKNMALKLLSYEL
ncbi:ribosomal L7Ae/L30e/S12e/Gadd45 family protein [uncultured Clostridium sp.]|jgi:ribosomal protein L7Ae-like RNA K-turn-binding protein|uniref:ribosomal L7Ae/L30e/S12e/Gadd45 family protein n=1 Tax=uncultured Clostridium sp. TaxID=59620 RepID=UPI002626D632|nr:ribosomal L7Ae/L30e/S12e/Gadd45 family protein [uncultured Clostridium sp.]